jgi:hypothetical protein
MSVTTEKKRERKEGVVEEPFERGRWWLCSMGSLRRELRREERDDGGRAAGTNALEGRSLVTNALGAPARGDLPNDA